MVLYKLEEFAPNHQNLFGSDDIKGCDVYADRNDEKIGTVKNILVDEGGRFRYLVVDIGFWVFGKQVLLPIGRSRIAPESRRIHAVGLTKEQVENLPEFNDSLKIDYDYEEQVRGIYRPSAVEFPLETSPPINASVPLDASVPLEVPPPPTPYAAPGSGNIPTQASRANYDRDSYTYQQEPSLYDMNERDHQSLKLYEERLIADKKRVKSGEVAIGKQVETETVRVSVPVERERVIIERTTPADAGRTVAPSQANFQEGEVAHLDIYQENPDIHKEAFVREEVRVKKVVERDTATAQEQIRREELDVDTEGGLKVNRPNR